jgi:hypothetical protein
MNSPTPHPFWHAFAQGCAGVLIGIAMVALPIHCFRVGLRPSSHDLRSLRCYPSPSLRSGPSQAGPILMCDPCNAGCVTKVKNCFQIPDLALESGAITTNLRGSSKCRSRLSSSLFLSYRWPVACRTPHRAAWLVRQAVRLSPMPSTATCLPGPSSAVLPVLQPAASSLACRPATRATKLGAFGRIDLTRRTIRDALPGGPFAFPTGGTDV